MTGFARASASAENVNYSLEIKSLNGKFLKSTIRLPEILSCYEARVEQILRNRLIRGSITYLLRVKDSSEDAAWEVNLGAIKGYIHALEAASELTGRQEALRVDLANLLTLPGVCQQPELDTAKLEAHWAILQKLTGEAVDQLIAMRHEEGKALQADLEGHCNRIAEALVHIRDRAPKVVSDYTEKLRNRVQNLLTEVEIQLREEDLVREVSIFAERSDINEELSRLESHLAQFKSVMANEENAGRKLEFLGQEMLRETNTIGAKANDSQISYHVVEIKGHIDRIKEQVMNVV